MNKLIRLPLVCYLHIARPKVGSEFGARRITRKLIFVLSAFSQRKED